MRHLNFSGEEILETITMVRTEQLDIRTITVGIIAGIANVLADANVNILDISQSVIREFFTMIMMVDLAGSAISFHALREKLQHKGLELGVRVEIQREEIFKAMHRI